MILPLVRGSIVISSVTNVLQINWIFPLIIALQTLQSPRSHGPENAKLESKCSKMYCSVVSTEVFCRVSSGTSYVCQYGHLSCVGLNLRIFTWMFTLSLPYGLLVFCNILSLRSCFSWMVTFHVGMCLRSSHTPSGSLPCFTMIFTFQLGLSSVGKSER
jgi:hypothetical protein